MNLSRVLDRVARSLREQDVEFAVIGGLALAAHGAPRATIDLDLLVGGENADRLHEILAALGYETLHRSENVANYVSQQPDDGRVDVLFVRRARGRAILSRARALPILHRDDLRVVDASDLIGLKVQSSSNDPARSRTDMADIEQLLRRAPELDLERVRDYFRLFDREVELEALLAGIQR
jgi:hypothetical protein